MATSKLEKSKFTWGDVVRVKEINLVGYPSGKVGSVCGISEVISQAMVDLYKQPIGSIVYTVEFSDGESTIIPECYLETVKNN